MAIDNLAQLGAPAVKPVSSQSMQTAPAASAPAVERQELPGKGEALQPLQRPEEVKEAVNRIIDYVQSMRRDLQFQVDAETRDVIVRVVDSESGELIRQIPSEELLAIARSLEQNQGLFLNTQA
jgi:flagellar protein FlaG